MINLILFIIMACYALYINHSWYKHCNELNDRWADVCQKIIEEEKK